MELSGEFHAPTVLPPAKIPLNRKLVASRARKNVLLPLPGFKHQIVQPSLAIMLTTLSRLHLTFMWLKILVWAPAELPDRQLILLWGEHMDRLLGNTKIFQEIQGYPKWFILCGFIIKRRLRTRQTVVWGIPSSRLALLFDFLGLRWKFSLILCTLSSVTCSRPVLLPLHKHPVS